MSFVTDKEELKPGLIIFRRGDVDHRNWYCRIKLPKADRYKTISLRTSDKTAAMKQAFHEDVRIQIKLEDNSPIFNRPFSAVAEEYAVLQDKRAAGGEISRKRAELVRSIIKLRLNAYVGTTQIHLIAQDRWDGYPAWRRAAGQGRMARTGSTRPFTDEEAEAVKAKAEAAAAKAKAEDERWAKVGRKVRRKERKPPRGVWVMVSDATIRTEMSVFRAVMSYAVSKRYVTADRKFESTPDLRKMRRDEFTLNEYRALHSKGRAWVRRASAERDSSQWAREVVYNFILIMCNTGMRPPEAKNLRWRDITPAKDKDGRDIVVLWVRGKGKQRKLVAPGDVGKYFERIRTITKEKRKHIPIVEDGPVFTTYTGKPAMTLYDAMIEDLLDKAGLRIGPSGIPRSTYCFRHTYATLRLSEGVDVYFLAQQMGTSVKMIEDHYGHVNAIRHADRVLHGMGRWDLPEEEDDETGEESDAAKTKAGPARSGRSAARRGGRSAKAVATKADAAARQVIKVKQPANIGSGVRPRR